MGDLTPFIPAQRDDNPFDAIRRVDEFGEYWSARELMPHLGYERWERFEDALDRARAAAKNAKTDPEVHFRADAKVIPGGRWGQQTVSDYQLTRYACYLVGMNGDPRKEQVAAAQTYFAVKTREAEVSATKPALPQTYADALRALLVEVEERERVELALGAAEERIAIDAPKAASYDRVIETEGMFSMTGIADMCNTSVNKFTGWLADLGIFRKGEYELFPGRRLPRKAYQDQGLYEVRLEQNDKGFNYPVAYATPAGLDFTLNKLRENGLID